MKIKFIGSNKKSALFGKLKTGQVVEVKDEVANGLLANKRDWEMVKDVIRKNKREDKKMKIEGVRLYENKGGEL